MIVHKFKLEFKVIRQDIPFLRIIQDSPCSFFYLKKTTKLQRFGHVLVRIEDTYKCIL